MVAKKSKWKEYKNEKGSFCRKYSKHFSAEIVPHYGRSVLVGDGVVLYVRYILGQDEINLHIEDYANKEEAAMACDEFLSKLRTNLEKVKL